MSELREDAIKAVMNEYIEDSGRKLLAKIEEIMGEGTCSFEYDEPRLQVDMNTLQLASGFAIIKMTIPVQIPIILLKGMLENGK
jgi:hypothetical protein